MYKNGKCKAAAILAYFTWLCWIIGLLIRDKDDELSRHHLNQGLVLALAGSIATLIERLNGIFDIIGGVIGLAVFILSVMGIVRAAKGSSEPLPFVGDIKLL